MHASLLLFVACVLAVVGCMVLPEHPALKNAALPPLLPVRTFVANIDYNEGYQVSPDGRKVAWIAVHRLRPRIFVKTIGRDDTAAVLPEFSFEFRWAADSRRLLVRKFAAAESSRIVVVDTDKPNEPAVDLTPTDNIVAAVHDVIASDPFRVLVLHNQRNKQLFDLYSIDLDTRLSTLVGENPGDVVSWVTDRRGVLRGRVRYAGERRWLELREQDGGKEVFAWTIHETVTVLGFSADGEWLWLLSNRGRDRVALTRVDTKTGHETIVYEDPRVDVTQVYLNPASGAPLVAYSHPDYPRTHVFDAAKRAELETVVHTLTGGSQGPVGVEFLSTSDNEQVLIVSLYTHAGKRYYLFDRAAARATLLGADAIHRHASALAPIQPIAVQSRDGLTIHGYLTLPLGVPANKLPLVLLVHGGPWARNIWADADWQWDAMRVRFLANRGYAVLQLNYRGSTGYGRKFTEAAVREFGGKMQDDLLDGVQWAIAQGIADPAKIAIMGASYGGYATLVGLTSTPTVFACGVAQVAPSDLVSLIENLPEYWKHEMPAWRRYVGDPGVPEERARMIARSPLFRAEALQRPLLLIQGAEDVRVLRNQAERMAAALRKAGKDADYVLIEGMGHTAMRWPENMKIYRKTEDFLARCLGGRSSGFDFFELGAWAFRG